MRGTGLGLSALLLVALAGCGDDDSGQRGYTFGPSGSGGGAGGAAGASGSGSLFGGSGGGLPGGGAAGATAGSSGGPAGAGGAVPGGSGGSLSGGGSGGSLPGGSGGIPSAGGSGGSLPGGSGGSPPEGGSGGTSGSGGSLPGGSGGAGGGSTGCPPSQLPPLPMCGTFESQQNPLINCFCDDAGTASDCKQKWGDCAADPGCSKAVACVNAGCGVTECAQLAGSGVQKALALQSCQSQFAGMTCQPNGQGGSGGASGAGGSGGGSPTECQSCALQNCPNESFACFNDATCQSCINDPYQAVCATNSYAQAVLACSCTACPGPCSAFQPFCP